MKMVYLLVEDASSSTNYYFMVTDEGVSDEQAQERRMRLLTLLTFVFEIFLLFSLIISSPLLFSVKQKQGESWSERSVCERNQS
jgi:hypothetical protein